MFSEIHTNICTDKNLEFRKHCKIYILEIRNINNNFKHLKKYTFSFELHYFLLLHKELAMFLISPS